MVNWYRNWQQKKRKKKEEKWKRQYETAGSHRYENQPLYATLSDLWAIYDYELHEYTDLDRIYYCNFCDRDCCYIRNKRTRREWVKAQYTAMIESLPPKLGVQLFGDVTWWGIQERQDENATKYSPHITI
jgi:hypothetical protein